jgi:hypothetical protein
VIIVKMMIFTAVYKDLDDVVLHFSHGTYHTLDKKYFQDLEFKAQEANVTEMELENFEFIYLIEFNCYFKRMIHTMDLDWYYNNLDLDHNQSSEYTTDH